MSGSAIRDLQSQSGLRPSQLGQLLGVSPNAVNLWIAGGQISPGHLKATEELRDLVDSLPGGSPAERRSALFAPRQGKPSIFDGLVRRHAEAPAWYETPPTPDQQAAVDDAATLFRRSADHVARTTGIHGGVTLDRDAGRALATLLDSLAVEADQIGPNPRGLDLAAAVLGERG